MIATLRGIVLEAVSSYVVIEAGYVGYGVHISEQTAASLPPCGQEVMLFTHLAIREDAHVLYGFATKEERALFERLITISGIGPKIALAALSLYKPHELINVIIHEDSARMAQVPGVGKKTAQRIILELKSVLEKDPTLYQGVLESEGLFASQDADVLPVKSAQLAQDALLAMGFTEKECEMALQGFEGDFSNTSEVVSYALKRLGSA